jgi:hypothetical protein
MDQAGKLRLGRVSGWSKDELINHALTPAAAMNQEIFHIFQSTQMLLQSRIAPCSPGPDIFAAKAKVGSIDLELCAFPFDAFIHKQEQSARLRWQFIERPAQDFLHETIRDFDIVESGFERIDKIRGVRGGKRR